MRFITRSPFRSYVVTLASLAALTIAVGCSGGASDGLSGAHFDIPYYPGAKVTERDTGGFQAGDSFSSLESYDYVSWSLSTGDPMDKVVAFYTTRFPKEVEEAKQYDAQFATKDRVLRGI